MNNNRITNPYNKEVRDCKSRTTDCYVSEKVWDVYDVDEKGNYTFSGRGYSGDDK